MNKAILLHGPSDQPVVFFVDKIEVIEHTQGGTGSTISLTSGNRYSVNEAPTEVCLLINGP